MERCLTPRSMFGALLGVFALTGCATSETALRVAEIERRLSERAPHSAPVLFVLTSADEQILANGKTRPTGVFLGELYEAYRSVRAAGFSVAFATPGAQPAAIDPESLQDEYWTEHPEWLEEARALVEQDPALRTPLSLEDALAQEASFAALVVPGGQGVMVDLLGDPSLHALLVRFGETGRPVGLICHAPALLLRLPEENPFKGRAVTSVSGFEEFYIETFIMKGRAEHRAIGRGLAGRGYAYDSARPKADFAVRDGNLVTSQNPYSGAAFSLRFLEALVEHAP